MWGLCQGYRREAGEGRWMSLLRDELTLSLATSSSHEVIGTAVSQGCSRSWAAEKGSAEGWSLQSSEFRSLQWGWGARCQRKVNRELLVPSVPVVGVEQTAQGSVPEGMVGGSVVTLFVQL